MKVYQRNALARAISTALAGSVIATSAVAQDNEPMLEEITVTAQKRTENLQDVPVSVQVLGNQQLEDLNLDNFGSYIEFLPTVSFQAERPGVAQIYMRGISSGGDGVHSGSMPSVGVYLDEQPITTINHILDLHMYDISRIETLAGPQGTFFGASSQAGTLRIITNAPVIGEYEGGFDLGLNTVKDGDLGYTAEGYWNMPIGDNAALRVVGWHVQRGGYIDNVPGSILLRGVNETINNDALVEENFNDNTLTGARAQLKIDLNDNWTVTPGLMYPASRTPMACFPRCEGDRMISRSSAISTSSTTIPGTRRR
ncbi:MAG: TonB-dependent receptor plug domain-containing protein [Woeseiaceae bacterium]|nr:TonB-dependent receptor plug domain-containing protein [Woeseiaceae bacterium]